MTIKRPGGLLNLLIVQRHQPPNTNQAATRRMMKLHSAGPDSRHYHSSKYSADGMQPQPCSVRTRLVHVTATTNKASNVCIVDTQQACCRHCSDVAHQDSTCCMGPQLPMCVAAIVAALRQRATPTRLLQHPQRRQCCHCHCADRTTCPAMSTHATAAAAKQPHNAVLLLLVLCCYNSP